MERVCRICRNGLTHSSPCDYRSDYMAGVDDASKPRDARIAELERVLKLVAAYVEEGECDCLNFEEDLSPNPCDFCVASREIKTVMGAK